MFGFDLKDVFCLFSLGFFFFWFWNGNTKTLVVLFLNRYDPSRSHKKTRFFWCLAFETISNHNSKSKNKKKHWVFCFFEILVESMYAKKQKNVCFVFGFWNQNKKTREKQNIFWVKTKHYPQSFFLFFFGFPGTPRLLALFFLFFQGFCGFGDSRYLYII